MTSDARKAISHTAIYGLGEILRNIVGFVMLPIYTRYLIPADYGVVELLTMISDLVGILLCNRIGEAVFRFYGSAQTEAEKRSVISTAVFLSVAVNSLGYLLIFALRYQFAGIVFGDVSYVPYIIAFSLTLVTQSLIELPLIYIRAQQKPWLFLGVNLFKLVLQVSCNVYFVVYCELHVAGVVMSALVSSTLMATLLGLYTFSKTGIAQFSKDLARKIISFSLPIALATLGSFYLTFGDRYFLRTFSSLHQVGLYSLGYKFGFVLYMLAWSTFANVWDSQCYEIVKRENAVQLFGKFFLYLTVYTLLLALGVSLFAQDFLRIIADPEYWPAHRIVPIIMLAYMIIIWGNFTIFGLFYRHQTKHIAFAEAVAVCVITVAYILLIPEFGAIGAAWATVCGFIGRFTWLNFQAQKLYNMHLPWKEALTAAALAVVCYLLSFAAPETIVWSVAFRALIMLGFIGALLYLPVLDERDRALFKTILRHPLQAKQLLRAL
ncbi:MAG: lipopolysaccharide biosynthesis protein [Gammaproteobacteria bacterium]